MECTSRKAMAPANQTGSSLKSIEMLQKITSDPDVCFFLDFSKLARSHKFEQALAEAVQHYLLHGDDVFIKRVVDVLKPTRFYRPALMYACNRASLAMFAANRTRLTYSLVDKEVKFKKVEAANVQERTIDQYIKSDPGSFQDMINAQQALKTPSSNARGSKKTKKKHIDMLDSKARLPGSFEGSKRR